MNGFTWGSKKWDDSLTPCFFLKKGNEAEGIPIKIPVGHPDLEIANIMVIFIWGFPISKKEPFYMGPYSLVKPRFFVLHQECEVVNINFFVWRLMVHCQVSPVLL